MKSFLLSAVLLAVAEAAAQPPAARECANCHGSSGEGGLTVRERSAAACVMTPVARGHHYKDNL